ncbi:hypothetical protein ABVT39_023644 [Epinephelus coioides]
MKDATTLMSEESNPTVSLIAPIHAQLLQNMTDTIGDSPMIHEIKNAIKTDLLKRYNSEAEKKILHTASALDPRFKGLPFLTEEERLEIYRGVTEEAASLEATKDQALERHFNLLTGLWKAPPVRFGCHGTVNGVYLLNGKREPQHRSHLREKMAVDITAVWYLPTNFMDVTNYFDGHAYTCLQQATGAAGEDVETLPPPPPPPSSPSSPCCAQKHPAAWRPGEVSVKRAELEREEERRERQDRTVWKLPGASCYFYANNNLTPLLLLFLLELLQHDPRERGREEKGEEREGGRGRKGDMK